MQYVIPLAIQAYESFFLAVSMISILIMYISPVLQFLFKHGFVTGFSALYLMVYISETVSSPEISYKILPPSF